MRNKRVIAAVTIIGDRAVLSFGYKKYLPLGRPSTIVQNLDRWGADEILLTCIDRGENGPHIELLREISELGVTTPIIYAGGVRTTREAIDVVGSGADRIAIDAGWSTMPDTIARIHEGVGAQAVIASVPVGMENQALFAYDYRKQTEGTVPAALIKALENAYVSEVILTDYQSEGTDQDFNLALLGAFPSSRPQLIAFGGIRTPELAHAALSHQNCVAVGVGNYLNYREHAVQRFKSALNELGVRSPQYNAFKTERPINAPDL